MASIFISYSRNDEKFAKRLSTDLKLMGVDVWIDKEQMKVGDSLLGKISSALESHDYFGIVISAASINSRWVQFELRHALTKEIESQTVRVLPILKEECPIPVFLTDKVYADFSGPSSYYDGLRLLLERLLDVSLAGAFLDGENLVRGEKDRKSRPEILASLYSDVPKYTYKFYEGLEIQEKEAIDFEDLLQVAHEAGIRAARDYRSELPLTEIEFCKRRVLRTIRSEVSRPKIVSTLLQEDKYRSSLVSKLSKTSWWANSPFAVLEEHEDYVLIDELIKLLPEREGLVMSLYYDENLCLREISEMLGFSESRVCQIHGQALMRLKYGVAKRREGKSEKQS